MKVLKVFSLHISLQMYHLLLRLLVYAMQKLLRQSKNLINTRISRCIRTLKHLHPLAAIVHSTSITKMMPWKYRTLLKKILLHSLCQLITGRKINGFLTFLFPPSYFLELCSSGNSVLKKYQLHRRLLCAETLLLLNKIMFTLKWFPVNYEYIRLSNDYLALIEKKKFLRPEKQSWYLFCL